MSTIFPKQTTGKLLTHFSSPSTGSIDQIVWQLVFEVVCVDVLYVETIRLIHSANLVHLAFYLRFFVRQPREAWAQQAQCFASSGWAFQYTIYALSNENFLWKAEQEQNVSYCHAFCSTPNKTSSILTSLRQASTFSMYVIWHGYGSNGKLTFAPDTNTSVISSSVQFNSRLDDLK